MYDDYRCGICDSRYCRDGSCRSQEPGVVYVNGQGWLSPDEAAEAAAEGYRVQWPVSRFVNGRWIEGRCNGPEWFDESHPFDPRAAVAA